MSKCTSCGAEIRYIKLASGKYMPVDKDIVCYDKDKKGKGRVVTSDGQVVSANIIEGDIPRGVKPGYGYTSHFATCPNSKWHRKIEELHKK